MERSRAIWISKILFGEAIFVADGRSSIDRLRQNKRCGTLIQQKNKAPRNWGLLPSGNNLVIGTEASLVPECTLRGTRGLRETIGSAVSAVLDTNAP